MIFRIAILLALLVPFNGMLDAYGILAYRFVDSREIECLAKNIYFEARGETELGQLAVAHVTVNRSKDPRYPDDICDVVYQLNQFVWTKTVHTISDSNTYQRMKSVAAYVLSGFTTDPTNGAIFFHASPKPPGRGQIRIGNQLFYNEQ